jgi:hypothetical protein
VWMEGKILPPDPLEAKGLRNLPIETSHKAWPVYGIHHSVCCLLVEDAGLAVQTRHTLGKSGFHSTAYLLVASLHAAVAPLITQQLQPKHRCCYRYRCCPSPPPLCPLPPSPLHTNKHKHTPTFWLRRCTLQSLSGR